MIEPKTIEYELLVLRGMVGDRFLEGQIDKILGLFKEFKGGNMITAIDYCKYPEEQKRLLNNLADCLLAIEKNNYKHFSSNTLHLMIPFPIGIHMANGPVIVKYNFKE